MINQTLKDVTPLGPIVNMGARREDGMGVTASKLGQPGYAVDLAFTEGSNSTEARRFGSAVKLMLQLRRPGRMV